MKAYGLLLLCIILTSMIPGISTAQRGAFNESKAGKARRSADVYFANLEYDKALAQYRIAIKHSRFDSHATFRAGLCLYYMSQDSAALIEFEKTRLLVDENGILNFYLARCNHLTYNFAAAIDYYRREIDNATLAGDTTYKWKLEKYIAECRSGEELMLRRNNNIAVRNLTVNSAWPDYAAFITNEGNCIFFTSGRPSEGKTGIDDEIFFTVKDTAGWKEALPLAPSVTTRNSHAVAGLSADGKRIYVWTDENNGDIYFSSIEGIMWSEPMPLPGLINSQSEESSICFTASGDTAYFVSNRPGTTGGRDIFYSVKNDNQWMEPVNIGEMINTPFDEESVFIENDTLYFSSKGHNTTGGFDIFRSVRSGNTWSKPENAGFPVNSPYDDLFYNSAGENIFFSSDRPGGMGKTDIYTIDRPVTPW